MRGLTPISFDARMRPTEFGWVGRDADDVRVGRVHRAHDRGIVHGVWRIAAVIHRLEAELRHGLAGARDYGLRVFSVRSDQRDGLRLGIHAGCNFKEAQRRRALTVRTIRDGGEITVVVELGVHVGAEQAHVNHVFLHDDRHRRCDLIGCIGRDDKVDLVDIDQLCVEGGHVRRIALVVEVHELHRPAEQTALRVDLVAPDLETEQ